MPKRFSERILDFLKRPEYRPMQAQRLARAMGVAEAAYGDFHDAVDALRRVGRVVLNTGNAVMLAYPRGQVVGAYRANPRGFGFVVPDEPTVHGDLYIAQGASLDAVTGDKVLCRVVRRGQRDGKPAFGGRIIEVIQRGDSRFVGQLRKEGGIWFVQPDGNTLHVPILIGDPGAKGARSGDQVVVEVVRYPSEGKPAKGVIVERLGKQGQPGVDLLSVIRQFHLPDQFPEGVLAEARAAVRSFDADAALADREDLSHLTTITIDPEDAKDYDDAITLERLGPGLDDSGETSAGNRACDARAGGARAKKRRGRRKAGEATWELGVHIADVSAFVEQGGALDEEAETRGTSVYFPGHVIPMLPELVSNGVCSLQEGEPRLCKSVFIRYDEQGKVVGTRYANTVIRSAKRLTYQQATAILEGRKARMRKAVIQLVERMDKLARAIQRRRLDDGMLVLDLPEVEIILDEVGDVVDAKPADTSFSHTIIEMFMVEANEAVARLLKGLDVPFLRRIHPEPDDGALEAMARFLRAAGLAAPGQLSPKGLQGLLESLRGRPEAYAVNLAVLKSMQMAEYSPEDTGHFALASKCYTHFTSPIRRYPDLMVHRLLESYLRGRPAGRKRGKSSDPLSAGSSQRSAVGRRRATVSGQPRRAAHRGADMPGQDVLVEAGRRLSYVARRAESAERELKTLKILKLLTGQVGDTFEGVVTGVTNFGLFVQHPRYLIDGLLRFEDLGDDWWDVDVKTGRVVGERTRRTLTMGTRVAVHIAAVDLPSRQLNLVLAPDDRPGKRQPSRKNKRRRRNGASPPVAGRRIRGRS
ncbi:MAG: VacB/RNase II family 3'-5' exoribonuclease [Phycisphaerae bacterium]|nr:VacB/RNase II family 3'-5' exoribonuclease [Phycisphaerae bacterium]